MSRGFVNLSERHRHYLVFCHAFTGCDTVSAIGGTTLFDRFCAGEHMDIFLNVQATKDVVIKIQEWYCNFTMHQVGAIG